LLSDHCWESSDSRSIDLVWTASPLFYKFVVKNSFVWTALALALALALVLALA